MTPEEDTRGSLVPDPAEGGTEIIPTQEYMDRLYDGILAYMIEEGGYGVVASFEEPRTIPYWVKYGEAEIPFEMQAGVILGDGDEDFTVVLGRVDMGHGSLLTIEFGPSTIEHQPDQPLTVYDLGEKLVVLRVGNGNFSEHPDGGVYGSFMQYVDNPSSNNTISYSDGIFKTSPIVLEHHIERFGLEFEEAREDRIELGHAA